MVASSLPSTDSRRSCLRTGSSRPTQPTCRHLAFGILMKRGVGMLTTGRFPRLLAMTVRSSTPNRYLSETEYKEEFCYNVKYIAQNFRPHRNPWSFRQIGIYERHDLNTDQSIWIILQPSERVCRRLTESVQSQQPSARGTEAASMVRHAAILIASSRDWGQYLECLKNEMEKLVLVLKN